VFKLAVNWFEFFASNSVANIPYCQQSSLLISFPDSFYVNVPSFAKVSRLAAPFLFFDWTNEIERVSAKEFMSTSVEALLHVMHLQLADWSQVLLW